MGTLKNCCAFQLLRWSRHFFKVPNKQRIGGVNTTSPCEAAMPIFMAHMFTLAHLADLPESDGAEYMTGQSSPSKEERHPFLPHDE